MLVESESRAHQYRKARRGTERYRRAIPQSVGLQRRKNIATGRKHRIVMDHFMGPAFKFTFDFDRVLPFDPAGGKGKTKDVFADAKISLSSPHGPPPNHPTKKEVDRYCALFLRLVFPFFARRRAPADQQQDARPNAGEQAEQRQAEHPRPETMVRIAEVNPKAHR